MHKISNFSSSLPTVLFPGDLFVFLFCFLTTAILMDMKFYPIFGFDLYFLNDEGCPLVILIFSCVYWLFVYLLWKNVYSSPLSIFKTVCFQSLSFRSYLYTQNINFLSYILFTSIFFHAVGCIFTLLVVSLDTKKKMKSILSIFYFCCPCL